MSHPHATMRGMDGEVVIDRVGQAVDLLRAATSCVDIDGLDPAEVTVLHRLLVDVEQLASGGRTRLARRLHDTHEWRQQGHRTPAAWLAAQTGTSLSQAKETIATSEDLPHLPTVDEALAKGELSKEQTKAVLPGARTSPEAEAELVAKATGGADIRDVRRQSREHVAAADPDPEATRRRHHRQRFLRSWIDDEGRWNARIQGPADKGAEFKAAIKAHRDRFFREANKAGKPEETEAYDFDALLAALANGDKRKGRGRERTVIGVVDVAALRRGKLEPGDTCRINGVGPVALSAITDLLGSATVKLLLKDGAIDLAVAHLGRQPTAFQRTALDARPQVCATPGCGATQNLQIDHTKPWADTHQTRVADLQWICVPCHDVKTAEENRRRGHSHPPDFQPPDHHPPDRHPSDRPPPERRRRPRTADCRADPDAEPLLRAVDLRPHRRPSRHSPWLVTDPDP